MSDEEFYRKCRETVATVYAFGDLATVHDQVGEPVQVLPIDGFFVTNPDKSVTYCDLVELHHVRNCAIRIGYIDQQVVKVRGMPLVHWKSPPKNA